jgi:hypothetical protein
MRGNIKNTSGAEMTPEERILRIKEIELEQMRVLLKIKQCEARLFEIIVEEEMIASSFIRNICSIRNDVFLQRQSAERVQACVTTLHSVYQYT